VRRPHSLRATGWRIIDRPPGLCRPPPRLGRGRPVPGRRHVILRRRKPPPPMTKGGAESRHEQTRARTRDGQSRSMMHRTPPRPQPKEKHVLWSPASTPVRGSNSQCTRAITLHPRWSPPRLCSARLQASGSAPDSGFPPSGDQAAEDRGHPPRNHARVPFSGGRSHTGAR